MEKKGYEADLEKTAKAVLVWCKPGWVKNSLM
jgi:hypothetical protein